MITDIEPLLGALYEGVMSTDGFHGFVAALVNYANLKAAVLCTRNRLTQEVKGLWLGGMGMEWMERYALHYAEEDLLARHIASAPIANFYASNLEISDTEIMQSRFFREWAAPQGVAYAAGSVMLREGMWDTQLFLQRAHAHGPFQREELRQLDRLVPHLQRAIQMRQRFIDCNIGIDMLSRGLDLLAMSTFLFDEHARIVHMNKSAQALIAAGDAVHIHGEHLVASSVSVSRKISYELTRAINAGATDTRANGLVLLPRMGRPPLMMVIAPLRSDAAAQAPLSALMFAFDPSQAPALTADKIRELFGLTLAEAELAAALCSGKTLAEIARERGTTLHTSRSQLKSIFSKTGAKRQADLVSLLLASPAYFVAEHTNAS